MNGKYTFILRQQGAALVVTLVLLVVALLLGVTSYQNARQEEAMAGNQRASSLAMMAAEYGAAEFWHDVKNAVDAGEIVPSGGLTSVDDFDSYMLKILEGLESWAAGQSFGSCDNLGGEVANACYRIKIDSISGDLVSVTSDGFVHEGPVIDANSNGIPDNAIARRIITMGWGVMLGESLSPFNVTGDIVDYDGINSQADVSGEEVDGYVNPAISVSGKDQAEKIVQDIVGKNTNIDDKAVFVPKDPSDCTESGTTYHQKCGPGVEGVYHAKDADVVEGEDVAQENPAEYSGNYDLCDANSNDLCNYKGGIASKLGSPILTKPEEFHFFINELVQQQADGDAAEAVWTDVVDMDHGAGVTFVTNKTKPQDPEVNEDVYGTPIYDPDNLQDDGERLVRPTYVVENGGQFSGSGVLVVDGDVEFKGDPDFDGLMIVLGDYKLSGGGNTDFTGAIISAPFSTHYQARVDGELVQLNPEYDDEGNFSHFLTPEPEEAVLYKDGDSWALGPLVDPATNENAVYADGYVTYDDFQAGGVENNGLLASKVFDPVGLDINGGGGQDHLYSFESIERAFAYFNGQTLLALLVGQATPDGTYEYGLSTWEEQVNIPDET